ncbi:dienelactone hydrolase family protein [Polychaeton citri CBS 116435]|uniref:Dienelactone hydrolase family protein n=1 Tax=Polychaeton citri CBS 116435 TaxID=1314669 RepID=A0A9P4UN05_9PEZI|nr:dienelactone hydrolase family protein [Polychaeton citri CBS 116435]
MSVPDCCVKGFKWDGVPTGGTAKLGTNDCYLAGNDPDTAILLIHDLLGWKFPNTRLLADHYAAEVGATVYVPDFFGGEDVPVDKILAEKFHEFDLPGFVGRNTRAIREPEIFACARELRAKHRKVGAVGFCFGGWAVFRLGSKGNDGLVDAISTGHPTWLTKEDIDDVAVPTQVLGPEFDNQFDPELKAYLFQRMVVEEGGGARGRVKVPFEYRHFPGAAHACFSRGDPQKEGEREALVRGKDAAVAWFRERLKF